jgi:hypothetical protein
MPDSKTTYISTDLIDESPNDIAARIRSDSKKLMLRVGRDRVIERLQELVNTGKLGFEGARQIYRSTFPGDLMAIKDR